jgi:uncharacterized iron-regulated protein
VWRLLALTLAVGCAAAAPTPPRPADGGGPCVPVGQWVDPRDGKVLSHTRVIARAARADVVLLGEEHDATEHHRWQLSVLAGLLARRGHLIVGLEALPRSAQSALDEWSAGRLDTATFLERSAWRAYWGENADEYLAIAHWARLNRQPLVALNVSHALVGRVGRDGWDAVPAAVREGLGNPVPADTAYRRALAHVYAEHACRDESAVARDPKFARFVEAQLTWDRAMAEAIASARRTHRDALVVGIMGRGHVEHGAGVLPQLAALGVRHIEVLLPWDDERPCGELTADLADAVFGVAAPADERAALTKARAALVPPCRRGAGGSAPTRTEPPSSSR